MFVYFFYRSPLWTAVAYAAFDIATNPESKEAKNKAVSVCKNKLLSNLLNFKKLYFFRNKIKKKTLMK